MREVTLDEAQLMVGADRTLLIAHSEGPMDQMFVVRVLFEQKPEMVLMPICEMKIVIVAWIRK